MAFNIAANNWLLKNQLNYDIVHLQGRSGNLFLWDKKKCFIPVVNTLHGLVSIEQDRAIGQYQNMDQKVHRLMATRMENRALEHADALVPVSQEMKIELEERKPELVKKSTQIYNGIDVPEELSSLAPNPNLLLFVGRITEIKGVFPLVEAMNEVKSEIELVMIGDGDAMPALKARIEELGLETRIRLIGALKSGMVEAWLERCSALILPSYHETQGIVLMEANAMGKPVIAMDIGGIKEVVEHFENGLLLREHSPNTISSGINLLFENRPLMEEMGKKGRGMMREKFAWEKIAGQTEELYGRLLFRRAYSKNSNEPLTEKELEPC